MEINKKVFIIGGIFVISGCFRDYKEDIFLKGYRGECEIRAFEDNREMPFDNRLMPYDPLIQKKEIY